MSGPVRRTPPPVLLEVSGLFVAFAVGGVLATAWATPPRPNLVVVLPTPEPTAAPDPVFALAAAAEATFYAPTPTRTPAPPPPTPTAAPPVRWCATNPEPGLACGWGPAPTPRPTPLPACQTFVPNGTCLWTEEPE